jgi:hypothetical protein
MFRDWSQRKDIDAFATALANDLRRRFPPNSEARTDRGAKNQLQAITETLCGQAVRFRRERKLGLYGKAKLGNVFRWQLREIGYSEAFIAEVTQQLVGHLARRG